jgi:ElaA protein
LVKQPDPAHLEWLGFADFSVALLYEALRFRQSIFVVEQRSPYADLDGLDPHARHLLWRNAGVLGGYLRLVPFETEERIVIGRVAVAPELRHRGLARRLMAEALTISTRDYPGYAVALSAQTYLAPFYERLGFVTISAPYDDCGVPHIEMIRRG